MTSMFPSNRISLFWEMNFFVMQNLSALSEKKFNMATIKTLKEFPETPFNSPGWLDIPGSNPFGSWIFVFKPYFCNCIDCLHKYISFVFRLLAHGWRINAINLCTFLLSLLNACVSLCCHYIDFNILKHICAVSTCCEQEQKQKQLLSHNKDCQLYQPRYGKPDMSRIER